MLEIQPMGAPERDSGALIGCALQHYVIAAERASDNNKHWRERVCRVVFGQICRRWPPQWPETGRRRVPVTTIDHLIATKATQTGNSARQL
jgi:hypothetical protein